MCFFTAVRAYVAIIYTYVWYKNIYYPIYLLVFEYIL